jgi:hypothetical protein
MSKPSTETQSIHETMEAQFRKTMHVVHAIKGNTEKLLTKTESLIEILTEEPAPATEPEEVIEVDIDEILAVKEHGSERLGAVEMEIIEDRPRHDPALVAEITKAVVREVMATINPVLHPLHKFVKDNALDKKRPAEVDDDAFAEKLIEEMKQSLGRRQRIALARKRMTSP